jgi:tryptophan synthase alpha chain
MAEATASRLEAAVRSAGGVRVIPYLMAGHPDAAASIDLGRRYAAAGAAAIEVGIPFSDPLADGPTIQRAGQAALEGGMTVRGALEVAAGIADAGVPVVLMTDVNPVLAYDAARFAADAAAAGVAGVIVPNLPPEEAAPVAEPLWAAGVDTVFLAAPTSTEERLRLIAGHSSGFVYCVTLTGVTGVRNELDPGLDALLTRLRAQTALPIAAGFGISRADHVRRLKGRVDAVAVGSALVQRVNDGQDPVPLLQELVSACP